MRQSCGNKRIIQIIILAEIVATIFFGGMIFTPKKTYILLPEDGNVIKLAYGHYYITCDFEVDKDLQTDNYLQYQRGAVGEYTAMVFLPLIAAGLWKIYTTPTDDENSQAYG